MAKEKFELTFLASGVMIDVINRRLRRPAMTPRESVGAAMYEVEYVLDAQRDRLAEPDAVAASLREMREELCVVAPRRAALDASLDGVVAMVRPVGELAEPVERLREAIADWLG